MLEVGIINFDVLGDVVAVVSADVHSFIDRSKVPAHLLGDASIHHEHPALAQFPPNYKDSMYTPHIDTGPSSATTLNNQCLLTIPACSATGTATATTTASQNNIIIAQLLSSTHCVRLRGCTASCSRGRREMSRKRSQTRCG